MPVLPVATRDADSAPFFDAAAEERLLIKRCSSCGAHARPDALMCAECGAAPLAWAPASGRATLITWAVVHAKPGRDGIAPGPSVIALVELEEGPWLHTSLDVADLMAIHAGMALRAGFVPAGEEHIPVFSPA